MGSPCPPHWTFAARAAYFGDRLCGFCDHRNPPGANFCNDCAAPLNLKPCRQCDGINDQSVSHCYKCGAAVSPVPAALEPLAPAGATPGDVPPGPSTAAALGADAPSGAPVRSAGRRVPSSGQIVVAAAVAVGLIAGAHQVYRVHAAKAAVMDVASPTPAPIAPTPAPIAPDPTLPAPVEAVVAQSTPPEGDAPADAQVRAPPVNAEVTQRVAVRRAPAPASAKERPNIRQRPAPVRHASAGRTATVGPRQAAARSGAEGPKAGKARAPDRWHLMQASLAGCGGDVVARVVCDQQVRRHFCEGHWGVAAECRGGVVNEHGQ